MEDKLIDFETAKLVKEKGFNVKTRAKYILNIPTQTMQLYPHYGESFDVEDTDILVPTQSLLQKWLREVHKIDITPSLVGNGYGFYIHKNRQYTNKGESYGFSGHTYELALEAGLQEALKLI